METHNFEKEIKSAFQLLDENIQNLEIENTNQALKNYIKTKFKQHHLVYICIIMLWVIFTMLFFLYFLPLKQNQDPRILLIPFIIPLILASLIYTTIKNKIFEIFYKQFANSIGFSFQETSSLENFKGSLFSLGHSQKIKNFLNGKIGENPTQLFNFYYSIKHGRSSTTYENTVFKIEFEKNLTPVLLLNKYNYFYNLKPIFENSKKISLENAFEKNFCLYTKEKNEIEALQVFDPNFLTKIQSDWQNYSIEFMDKSVYLYCSKIIGEKNELKKMFELAQHFAEKIEPKLYAMSGSVEAMSLVQKEKF